jgi:hypothetical protein
MMLCASMAADAGWFSYDNYDDCMLGRMKGQAPMMYASADKACKKEFGVEFGIWDKSDVKWNFNTDIFGKDGEVTITSATNGIDDYEITSGEFAFSEKSCEGLTAADFGKPVQLQFIKGKAKVPFGVNATECARALSFTGKYK